jgi:hypothetical protein
MSPRIIVPRSTPLLGEVAWSSNTPPISHTSVWGQDLLDAYQQACLDVLEGQDPAHVPKRVAAHLARLRRARGRPGSQACDLESMSGGGASPEQIVEAREHVRQIWRRASRGDRRRLVRLWKGGTRAVSLGSGLTPAGAVAWWARFRKTHRRNAP